MNSSSCDKNCEGCKNAGNCSSGSRSMVLEPHPFSSVKRVIGIVSGKGGVGKSLVAGMLAVGMNRRGHSTAILDGDITGPSIPNMFGVTPPVESADGAMYPKISKTGIKIMSVNLLLDSPDTPVLWRGPIIGGLVKQFWTDVVWDEVDYMFVDMPPGTGDVPLTVFQSIPLDGIIVVATPQQLVSIVVEKSVNMAKQMEIPILGMVRNMSYVLCPDCGKRIDIFEHSPASLELLGELPIDPALAKVCDNGCVELFEGDWLQGVMDALEKMDSDDN